MVEDDKGGGRETTGSFLSIGLGLLLARLVNHPTTKGKSSAPTSVKDKGWNKDADSKKKTLVNTTTVGKCCKMITFCLVASACVISATAADSSRNNGLRSTKKMNIVELTSPTATVVYRELEASSPHEVLIGPTRSDFEMDAVGSIKDDDTSHSHTEPAILHNLKGSPSTHEAAASVELTVKDTSIIEPAVYRELEASSPHEVSTVTTGSDFEMDTVGSIKDASSAVPNAISIANKFSDEPAIQSPKISRFADALPKLENSASTNPNDDISITNEFSVKLVPPAAEL